MLQSKKQSKVSAIVAKIHANENRCALSGWKISPTEFEIDHIVSMNDGGTDEVDNLQALHPLVNRAKGTMGNQQFIDMCLAVAARTNGRSDTASKDEVLAAVDIIKQGLESDGQPPHAS